MLDIIQYKCEVCEEVFITRNNEEDDDIDCIEETKRCRNCYDEFGEEWPDNI